jgi:hypothetical protein
MQDISNNKGGLINEEDFDLWNDGAAVRIGCLHIIGSSSR